MTDLQDDDERAPEQPAPGPVSRFVRRFPAAPWYRKMFEILKWDRIPVVNGRPAPTLPLGRVISCAKPIPENGLLSRTKHRRLYCYKPLRRPFEQAFDLWPCAYLRDGESLVDVDSGRTVTRV